MASPRPPFVWAKSKPRKGEPEAWHSLHGHCIDVAATMEALLALPWARRMFDPLAGRTLDAADIARLSALAFLHDYGKANRAFQARRGGHIAPAPTLFNDEGFAEAAGLSALSLWWPPGEVTRGHVRWILAIALSHHGTPPKDITGTAYRDDWQPGPDGDPLSTVAGLVAQAQAILPEAFRASSPPLVTAQHFRFWHAVLGLLQLADWIGSDDSIDAFPFERPDDPPRIPFARERAVTLLVEMGLDPAGLRSRLPKILDFGGIAGFAPTPIQEATAEAAGPIVVLEAETGSGKTEAALYRFARLFAAGQVDGLYFALPTRVAAREIHRRVQAACDRLFGAGAVEVVAALPGDAAAGQATAKPLPDFQVQWDDEPDGQTRRTRWAAESPKRFLAAPIAVGTVDQALMATITVRHAHLRSVCLARSLLVVDEVHSSDTYMTALLQTLLGQHCAAGGQALLLSATLGGPARDALVTAAVKPMRRLASAKGEGRAKRRPSDKPTLVDAETAEAMPYPALTVAEPASGRPRTTAHATFTAREKAVRVTPMAAIDDPTAIAGVALKAADHGARVLIVRNTVGGAVAVADALEAQATDPSVLFSLDGLPTLHHGRFAKPDRQRLDAAVTLRMGKGRPDTPPGLVLVGTQTLEQSLDIDADLLLTDLAPIDVLLQRIGRLHRHVRGRPDGFEQPNCRILVPESLDAYLPRIVANRPGPHGLGKSVYEDFRTLRATRDLIGEGTEWRLPAMNRRLVERATHPQVLSGLVERLAAENPAWRQIDMAVRGGQFAQNATAASALLKWDADPLEFKVEPDERATTRLGLADRIVMLPEALPSPFPASERIDRFTLPARWIPPGTSLDAPVTDIEAGSDGFAFAYGGRRFLYDRHGLCNH